MEEMWRVYRVAKLLDVSKKRIYQMVQEGKIDAIRLGPRSMRITRASIDKFITEGRTKNRTELGLDYKIKREARPKPKSKLFPNRRF